MAKIYHDNQAIYVGDPNQLDQASLNPFLNMLSNKERILVNKISGKKYTITDLRECPTLLKSAKKKDRWKGTIIIRTLLQFGTDTPIDEVINLGLCPELIKMANCFDEPYIQYEALWPLTNIASTTSAAVLVQNGIIPMLLNLTKSKYHPIIDQAVWVLGNVAGDSPDIASQIVDLDGIDILTGIYKLYQEDQPRLGYIKNSLWSMSNLCRAQPTPTYDQTHQMIDIFCEIICKTDNKNILPECLWGLHHLTQADEQSLTAVTSSGAIGRSIQFLNNSDPLVVHPALRVVGNTVIFGNDDEKNLVNNNGSTLINVTQLLDSKHQHLRRDALWFLSYSCIENENQIDKIMKLDNIIKKIMWMSQNDSNSIIIEACNLFSNVFEYGRQDHVDKLIKFGYVQILKRSLFKSNIKVLTHWIDGLFNILLKGDIIADLGDGVNPYMDYFEELGMFKVIEQLQYHKSRKIFQAIQEIMEEFFECEDILPEELKLHLEGSSL